MVGGPSRGEPPGDSPGHSPGDAAGVDASRWPLLVVTAPDEPTPAFTDRFTAQMQAQLDRMSPFCVLVDMPNLRRVSQVDLGELRRIAAFAQREGDLLDANTVALALHVPHAVVRAAMRLLFALRPPNHPYAIFKTRAAADAYLAPHLRTLGVVDVEVEEEVA